MYPLARTVLKVDGCGAPIGRAVSANDTVTLLDYRTRIALYRTDPDLSANHQMFPWISTWDDVSLLSFKI